MGYVAGSSPATGAKDPPHPQHTTGPRARNGGDTEDLEVQLGLASREPSEAREHLVRVGYPSHGRPSGNRRLASAEPISPPPTGALADGT